ncbi:DUF6671 family protein [Methylobacter svalbardensis]|uniref:DUF6671 family protein n=1 Tax=Methylobacter svalbardensis TaxID=3080016 RepID=UPI0030EDE000
MSEKTYQPNNEPSANSYRNQRVALLTQHGKEGVIGPTLEKLLGCCVEKVDGFDTDLLGTFTRDIAREGSQLDAARKKARIGMELSGFSIGIASEGAFGPDPLAFMLPGNMELLIWIDDRLGIEVVATSAGKTNLSHCLAESWEEAEDFARSAGFPEHHLVVRPVDENHPELRKGLEDWVSLKDAVTWALDLAPNRRAFIETDMRAFANPTRMKNIRLAAENLAQRLTSLCPACGAPGFSLGGQVRGLPCEDCGSPTGEAKADVHRCVRCDHQLLVEREREYAPARYCDYCNP